MNVTNVAELFRSRVSVLAERAKLLYEQAESRPTSSARFELLQMADKAAEQLGAEYHRRGFRRNCPGIIGHVARLRTKFLSGYNAASDAGGEMAHASLA
jgi:hypothetical protein